MTGARDAVYGQLQISGTRTKKKVSGYDKCDDSY